MAGRRRACGERRAGRVRGRPLGDELDERRRGASVALDAVTPERVLAAAHIKAQHPIAFADCFAAATASAHDATLLTGDPELLERDVGCTVSDLRAR
jgi:predicted nucleic acid-binding protein